MFIDAGTVAYATHARIVGTIIDHGDSRGRNGGGAHRAGLKRDPQLGAGQAFGPKRGTGLADCDDFGMGGGVGKLARAIAGTGQHPAIGPDQHRAHGHLAAQGGCAGLIQRLGHM